MDNSQMDIELDEDQDQDQDFEMNTNDNNDNNISMDVELPYERDYFLWISHGETITENYYRFETVTRIPKLLFYTTHGRFLAANISNLNSYLQCDAKLAYTNLLRYVPPFEVTNDYYLGVRENIVGKIINDTYYSIALPPLLYNVAPYNAEYYGMINVMGLYHFRINDDEKEMKLIEKVMDWRDIDREITVDTNKRTYLTYSKIESFIKNYVNKYNERYDAIILSNKMNNDHKINIDICSLGIFTCRSFSDKYTTEKTSNESSPVDVYKFKNQMDFTRPERFNEISMNDDVCLEIVGFNIDENTLKGKMINWKGPLAEIQYQGCAFNILNFYNILDDELSRSLAVCLPATGTSIFSFIDYLNYEIIKTHKRSLKYLVLRFTIDGLWDFLNECISSGILLSNTWFPIKLYRENLAENNKKSLVGHFVSLWFNINDKKVYLIDPQAQIFITEKNDIQEYMQKFGFQFADIILMSDVNPSGQCNDGLKTIIQKMVTSGETSVNLRPTELLWGGERLTQIDSMSIKPRIFIDNLLKEDNNKLLVPNKDMDLKQDIDTNKKIISIKELENSIDTQINNVLKDLLESEQINAVSFQEFSKNFPEDELFKLIKMDEANKQSITEKNINGGKTLKKQKSRHHNKKFSRKRNYKKRGLKKTIKRNRIILKKHKKTYNKK
jgi:hypothetical protein